MSTPGRKRADEQAFELGPIKSTRIYEEIVRQVKQLIAEGRLKSGDRLPPATRRVAAACVLFAPQIPLLFMGEEYGETAPFQFFTDHDDPAIAEATREGRKREFERFSAFAGEVPDPQDPATFERSKLDWSELDAIMAGLRSAPTGRPGWPPLAMLKALLLAQW